MNLPWSFIGSKAKRAIVPEQAEDVSAAKDDRVPIEQVHRKLWQLQPLVLAEDPWTTLTFSVTMTNPNEVYLVDDAYDYRILIKGIFARHLPDYQLQLFDGGTALSHHILRSQERPALILLDRHMPGRDGYQTLQLLKQHPYWHVVPVVMVSAEASAEDVQKSYRLGVNSFLQKPTEFESLRRLIEFTCQYWLTVNQPFDPPLLF